MSKSRLRILKQFFREKVGRKPAGNEVRKLKRMHYASVRSGEWAKYLRTV